MLRSLCSICLFLIATLAAPADSGWLSIHGDAGNNALQPMPSQVATLAGGPSWDSGPAGLFAGAGMALSGGTFYTIAMRDGGNWDPSDDVLTIKAFNAIDGTPDWESPPLDAGNSVGFGSTAGPTIDPASGALFYGSGRTLHRLSATGAIGWATTLTSATTQPAASLDLINSSPSLGEGRVFIATYSDFFGAYRDKQLVACDAAGGAIAWSVRCGGTGRSRPIFLDAPGGGLVLTEVFDGATSHGVAAYRAADGSLAWSHLSAPRPWSLADPIEAPLVHAGGRVYGVGYTSGGASRAFCIDPADGSLHWMVETIASDCPPLLAGGKLFIYGGAFGAAELVALDPADGALLHTTAIGGYAFRNAMAATQEHLYLAQSDFFGSAPTTDLVIVSLATGAVSARLTGTYTGPVMIDALGGIYVHYTAGGANLAGVRAFGQTVPVTLSHFEVQ